MFELARTTDKAEARVTPAVTMSETIGVGGEWLTSVSVHSLLKMRAGWNGAVMPVSLSALGLADLLLPARENAASESLWTSCLDAGSPGRRGRHRRMRR